MRQTAAGLVLGASPLPLSLGDRDFGDFDRFGLLEDLRSFPGLLLFLRLFPLGSPFESRDDERAGVAALGGRLGFPSCLNLHWSPRSHLPCFQNLQIFLPLPLSSLDGDLPRPLPFDALRSRFGGFSCLNLHWSLLQEKNLLPNRGVRMNQGVMLKAPCMASISLITTCMPAQKLLPAWLTGRNYCSWQIC